MTFCEGCDHGVVAGHVCELCEGTGLDPVIEFSAFDRYYRGIADQIGLLLESNESFLKKVIAGAWADSAIRNRWRKVK